MPPPKVPRETLRVLLEICTTKTPSRLPNGDLYVQVDGVSLDSCLGPAFADFFMCNLENKTFSEHPELKLKPYARYVDDIFIVFSNVEQLNMITSKFQSDSILNYTHEVEKDNKLYFLDCLVTKLDSSFQTSVYVKSIQNGDCLNYKNISSHSYKDGVIRTLLLRGKNYSLEQMFHEEVKRFKLLLVGNSFSMKVIHDHIARIIHSTEVSQNTTETQVIQLKYRYQMTFNARIEERSFKDFVRKHVALVSDASVTKIRINYKTKNALTSS